MEEQRHNQGFLFFAHNNVFYDFTDLIDSSTDETKSIASCKAVSLIAGDAVTDNPNKKLETEMDIKSYQQSDWKSLNHLAYREDNSLQQLVSTVMLWSTATRIYIVSD